MKQPTAEEQLAIIKEHWYPEAAAFKAAGIALRACVDGEGRAVALRKRIDCLARSDALCDAYNDLRKTHLDQAAVAA